MKDDFYYKVAVEAPLEPLIYRSSKEELLRGQSLKIPLGKRVVNGVVIDRVSQPQVDFKIRNIKKVILERPRLPEAYLLWCEWLSQYYFYPLGSILSSSFPQLKKSSRTSKDLKKSLKRKKQSPFVLTEEQKKCLDNIKDLESFSVHLIHGVTGSGKTEIYLQILEKVRKLNKTALILVPEIGLTSQMLSRFSQRFPEDVAVIHSSLTPRKRTNEWWSMIDKKKSILIGARSSLFCPLSDLGLIVVDEEHEASFKQEEKLRYQARDASVMLASLHNCPILLGSATPSLESWYNVMKKKYHKHTLKKRASNLSQAFIQVINMKDDEIKENRRESGLPDWLSQQLYQKIKNNLENQKQSALFLNRRGVAAQALCTACGFIFKCPNCDISLTLHGKKYLNCHYCDYSDTLKENCPECKEPEIKFLGLGTEKVTQDLKKLFKKASLKRVDRDRIRTHKDMEDFIHEMEEGSIDILVGTQMISKGLDFPRLTLIGFVLADIEMNWPDFRTSERAFQSFTQVAGRSGRHEPGEVVVQTYSPDNLSLSFFKFHELEEFMTWELKNREERSYPPYGNLLLFRIQGLSLSHVKETCHQLLLRANSLKSQFKGYKEVHILGPTASSLMKIKNRYRYNMLIKSKDVAPLKPFGKHILETKKWIKSGVKVILDRDPYSII